jgi:hypothetical protein
LCIAGTVIGPSQAAAFGFIVADSVITKKTGGKSCENPLGNRPFGRPVLAARANKGPERPTKRALLAALAK